MSSVEKYCKEIVIDEDWRGKSKVLRAWGKKYTLQCKKRYILHCKKNGSVYPDKMIFFNIEEYKKMRGINEFFFKMFTLLFLIRSEYGKVEFIECMIEEVNIMKKIVKKCDFFNVNYGKGIVFQKKFKYIVKFMEEEGDLEFIYDKILEVSFKRKSGIDVLCDIFLDRILPELYKIRRELLLRNIYMR